MSTSYQKYNGPRDGEALFWELFEPGIVDVRAQVVKCRRRPTYAYINKDQGIESRIDFIRETLQNPTLIVRRPQNLDRLQYLNVLFSGNPRSGKKIFFVVIVTDKNGENELFNAIQVDEPSFNKLKGKGCVTVWRP